MIRTLVWLLIPLGLTGGFLAGEEKPVALQAPKGAALMRAHQESVLWMARVKSLHLKAISKNEKTLPGLLKSQRDVQRQFNPGKNPDPLDFKELLPQTEIEYECDFDRTRFHQITNFLAPQKILTDRHILSWDGTRGVNYQRDLYRKQEFHAFEPNPKDTGSFMFSIGMDYTKPIGTKFWWHDTPENRKNHELSFGKPEDFVYVGDDEFHGVDCHVLLSSRGNQSDRYYFGVKDQRLYGAKEGIIGHEDMDAYMLNFRRALEEVHGKEPPEDVKSKEYQELIKARWTHTPEQSVKWCRILYARVAKNYTPCFEYWFDDYRELGNGRILPFVQTTLNYTHEKNANGVEEIFLDSTRTLTIEEIAIDQPLPEKLFEAPPIKVGAIIIDNIHKPRLRYEYKERFSDEEWELIEKKGKQREEQEAKRKPQKDQGLLVPAQKK